MNSMESKGMIYKKIPAIMLKVGVVGKDRKNEKQGYKFRGIDDMYNALNQHLGDEGVFFTSEVLSQSREERQSNNGGTLIYSVVTMKFTAIAEDGSSVSSITVGEAMDSGDKSMNKAMSTAYKYMMMQLFCIPTDEPKDSENDTYEVAKTSGARDLGEVVADMKVEEDINHLVTLKDEGKSLAFTEKQKAWLQKEFEQAKARISL